MGNFDLSVLQKHITPVAIFYDLCRKKDTRLTLQEEREIEFVNVNLQLTNEEKKSHLHFLERLFLK